MKSSCIYILLFLSFYLFFPSTIFAQTQLIGKQQTLIQGMYFPNEIKLPDPTVENQTIYSALLNSHAVDSYYFIPQKNSNVTIETLVPVRSSNQNFGPAWELIGPNVPPQPMMIEFSIPTNSNDIGHDYYPPTSKRSIIYDLISMEPLYRGNIQTITVIAGQIYYINVFEPYHYLGDYVLKISGGQYVSLLPSLSALPSITLNQVSIKPIAWIPLVGLLCAMLGLIVGLGFGLSHLYFQKLYSFSPPGKQYYAIAQIVSIFLFVSGLEILLQQSWSSLFSLLQLAIAIGLCILFIVMYNKKVTTKAFSFLLVSLLLWFVELISFVWYLLVLR